MANRYAELTPAQKISVDRRINALASVGDWRRFAPDEDGLNDDLIALLWEAKEAMLDGLNRWIELSKTFADEDREEDAVEVATWKKRWEVAVLRIGVLEAAEAAKEKK